MDSLKWPMQWKTEVRFGIYNVSSLQNVSSLKRVAGKSAVHKLQLGGMRVEGDRLTGAYLPMTKRGNYCG